MTSYLHSLNLAALECIIRSHIVTVTYSFHDISDIYLCSAWQQVAIWYNVKHTSWEDSTICIEHLYPSEIMPIWGNYIVRFWIDCAILSTLLTTFYYSMMSCISFWKSLIRSTFIYRRLLNKNSILEWTSVEWKNYKMLG